MIAHSVFSLTMIATMIAAAGTAGAEQFRKLAGAQIQAKIAGMEITDGVHSSDLFERNGTLNSFSMSRKSFGKWRVQKDELCLERGKDEPSCYEVWLADKNVEFRRKDLDLPLFEGVLRPPARHN